MSRVAFALLWCFVFVIPWEEIVRLPGLGSLPRLVGILASAVGVLYVLGRGSFRRLSWFQVLAALFVLWAGIGAFWSIDPEATRVRVLTYVQLAVLAWLIWELAWSPERQRALFEAYVMGAGVGAAAIIRNYLSGVAIDETAARFTGFNANPNELGLTLALALPIAWYLGASHSRRGLALAWWLYVPVGTTAVLLTGSRGAMVAALVGLLIVPWTLTQVREGTRAALYMLGVGSIVLVGTIAPEATLERLSTTRSQIETRDFGGRGEIWRTGLNVAWEHPFGGVGAGAFGAAVAPTLGGRRTAHQTFLAILVEEGFIGLTLFVAMVASLLNRLANLQTLDRRLAIMLLAVLAVGSLSSAWDYKKQLWLMLGLLAAQTGSRLVSRTTARARAVPLRTPQGAIAQR